MYLHTSKATLIKAWLKVPVELISAQGSGDRRPMNDKTIRLLITISLAHKLKNNEKFLWNCCWDASITMVELLIDMYTFSLFKWDPTLGPKHNGTYSNITNLNINCCLYGLIIILLITTYITDPGKLL